MDDAEPQQPVSAQAPTKWLRIGRLLLAPVLATAAAGVHFMLNVPDKIPEPPPEEPKKKPGKGKKPARPKVGDPASRRSLAELEADWAKYRGVAFEDEPVDSTWSRKTKTAINRAVVVAREHSFEGAPEPPHVVVAKAECRTIRCRFVLRSPFRHEVELLYGALAKIELDGVPLWLDISSRPVEPDAEAKQPEHAIEVTVALAAHDVDNKGLAIPAAEPEAGAAESGNDPLPTEPSAEQPGAEQPAKSGPKNPFKPME